MTDHRDCWIFICRCARALLSVLPSWGHLRTETQWSRHYWLQYYSTTVLQHSSITSHQRLHKPGTKRQIFPNNLSDSHFNDLPCVFCAVIVIVKSNEVKWWIHCGENIFTSSQREIFRLIICRDWSPNIRNIILVSFPSDSLGKICLKRVIYIVSFYLLDN